MLDIEMFGLNPLGHHLHTLGLHVAVTLLLFWVLRSMTGALWRSAFVALAFGLHPLHVESVAWAAERKDVLCAVFWMLTLAAYLSYARRGGALRYVLMVLCFALGLMAKPMIVTLPVVLLALDFWPLGRLSIASGGKVSTAGAGSGGRPTPLTRLILEKVPLCVLTLASSLVTFSVQQKGGAVAGLTVGLGYRLSNALVSYVGYLCKIVYPAHLALVYPAPPNGWPLWKPVICLLLLVLVSIFILYYGKQRPYLPVGWAWYLVTLVPVIGLVQIGVQAMADRYSYLPSVGVFILLSWGAAELAAPWRRHRIVLAALGILLGLGMLAGTRAQSSHWKDSESLYRHALSVTRDNYIVYHFLATLLGEQGHLDEAEKLSRESLRIHAQVAQANLGLGQILEAQGKYAEAMQSYEQAMQLAPADWEAFYKAGALKARQGLLAEAESLLRKSLQLNDDSAKPHIDLGQVLTAQKKYAEASESYERAIQLDRADFRPLYYAGGAKAQQRAWGEAADYFQRSIRLNPGYAEAHFGLGLALQQQGKTGEATAQWRAALELKPDDGAAWTNLADCLRAQGRPQEAIESYRQALKLRPRDVAVCYKLAQILKEQGRVPEAASQQRRALELKPDFVPSLNDLAWILATAKDEQVRDPSEALRLAEKACELTSSRDYNCLDTLAAAYARANQFEKAVETAQKAIALAKAANQANVVQDVTRELQLYQTRQAYVEP
jgi:tetratricopeptide (TPR) repeat protein